MIRELAEALAPKSVKCSQWRVGGKGSALEMVQCPGVAIAATPAELGAGHPRPLCASCAKGLAYVFEHDTLYTRQVVAAGIDPLELAAALRRAASRGLS